MIDDAIRNVIWGVLKLLLSVCNWMYELIVQIVSLDFSNMQLIIDFWFMMSSLILGLVTIRVYLIYTKKTASDDEAFNGIEMLSRIVKIVIVTSLCVPLFNIALAFPNYINNAFNKYVVYQTPMSPSTSIISTTAKTSVSGELKNMISTDEIIDINKIDENLNKEDANGYIYFFGYAELLLCAIAAFLVFKQQADIFIEAGCRRFINIYRFILGFIPISTIVEDNSTFGDWVNDIISDTATTSVLLIFTNFAFCLVTYDTIAKFNGIVRLAVLFLALSGIKKIGDMIAKYLHASNLKSDGKGLGVAGFFAARSMMKATSNIIGGMFHQMANVGGGLSDGAFSGAMEQGDHLINSMENMLNDDSQFPERGSFFADAGYHSSPFAQAANQMADSSPLNENPINNQFNHSAVSPLKATQNDSVPTSVQGELKRNMSSFRAQQNKARFYYGMARKRGMGYMVGYAAANESINKIFSKFESPFANDDSQSGHIYNNMQLTNDYIYSPLTNSFDISETDSTTDNSPYKDGRWRDDNE